MSNDTEFFLDESELLLMGEEDVEELVTTLSLYGDLQHVPA